ncbi:hypothetical protein Pmani_024358 [Petrolisthes manimaculis]|uniref:Uncharacterized protein n=1 Tax=Petrolisthes manimaculis TaxID=1843537 RepID=A0AAE1PA01_9EUCA|nr:hypothetical protein Pmani_024358 [Petrolisthes manimaculis]
MRSLVESPEQKTPKETDRKNKQQSEWDNILIGVWIKEQLSLTQAGEGEGGEDERVRKEYIGNRDDFGWKRLGQQSCPRQMSHELLVEFMRPQREKRKCIWKVMVELEGKDRTRGRRKDERL